jgi:hypothetical protein
MYSFYKMTRHSNIKFKKRKLMGFYFLKNNSIGKSKKQKKKQNKIFVQV